MAINRADYLKALVLQSMASDAHNQRNFFMGIGNEELMDIYDDLSSELHDLAQQIFPLYPHPDFLLPEVQEFVREMEGLAQQTGGTDA